MNRSILRYAGIVLGICAAAVTAPSLNAQLTPLPEATIQVPSGTDTWIEAPASLPAGTRMLLLEGHPAREGFFSMRLRLPTGARLQPHWHPADERVTVLSGLVRVGFGDHFDESAMATFGPGSFYLNPARSRHYVRVVEPTEMQVTGMGPWEQHMLADVSTDVGPREPVCTDLGVIAASIARRSARVQPGELVWIEGGADDVAFMERLATAIGVEGGHPIVTVYSDEMVRRWYQEVPERFDTLRDEWLWALNEKADVIIRMQSTDYSIYATIPAERLDAWGAANAGAGALLTTRAVRVVRVGNGLHPSAWRARMLGVELSELERIFRTGLVTQPAALAARGERLRELLRGASTVRVQHPNGTDITVGIGRGHIVVSDGSTSRSRSPDHSDRLNETWLPGGEVTLGLDTERADGRLVVERIFLDAQAVGPVTFLYHGGRLQALESDVDLSILRRYIDPSVPPSEQLTGLKFGLNPDVTDARVLPLMGAGMFSLSMGSNRALGGDIDLPFMFFLTLAGATVHVDDRLVVQDGMLMPDTSGTMR